MRGLIALGLATAVGLALLAGAALRRDAAQQPPFLATALGPELAPAAGAQPARRTSAGARVRLPRSGYELESGKQRLALASADPAGQPWRQFERGATRTTPFGSETVIVDGDIVEQFLTVTERRGPKTWRWKLDTGTLKPHLRPDGSVLVSAGNVVAGFRISPAAILDRRGRDVSPAGTAWGLERRQGDWWLTLDLDDRDLPLPYVIDPATIALRAAQGATNGGGATTLTITKPAGLAVDDQMLAQITVRGGSNTVICAPAGWTSVDRRNSGTTIGQEIFRNTADATDVAATSFAFTFDTAAGCASPDTLKATGGVVAYFGVNNAAPIAAVAGQANASSANIVAPTITPSSGDVIVGAFGIAINTTITPPTGSTPTFTERWDTQTTGSPGGSNTTSELATALSDGTATGARTAVAATSAVNIGQLVALDLDTVAPTAPVLTVSESDTDTYVTGSTLFYRPAGNGGSFTVSGTVATETGSGVKHVTFPALTGGFTPTAATNDTTSTYSNDYTWTTGATDTGAKSVTAEDNATNISTASTFTLTSDAAGPPTTVTTVEGTSPGLQHFVNTGANAYTLYYRPTATGDHTFSVAATDASSGTAQVVFPTLSATGFTGGPSTDTGTPYASSPYTFTTGNVAAPSSATIVSTDNVGNTTTDTITYVRDTTLPVTGALTVNGVAATGGGSQSYDSDGSFTIGLRTEYTDAGSGIASSVLTREPGTLSGNNCTSYGAPVTVSGTTAQSGLTTGCYRYTLTGTDNVGNVATLVTEVKVDTTAPGAPSLTLSDTSAAVHTTGTTAFYRAAGSGSFDVSATATDSESGVFDYTFPTLAGFTTSGSGSSRTYTLATPTEPNGSKAVTARNNALLTGAATNFTLTSDASSPTGGVLSVNGVAATGGGSQSYDGDGSFAIGTRTDYSADTGSGFATSVLTREDGTLSGDGCVSYGAPATVTGSPAQSGLATGCYRYTLTGTDNVGNVSTLTTVVKVDTSGPGAPGLTLSDSSAAVHTTGTTAFYRPAGSGSFDVTASSTDTHSGVFDYSFPALAGFTGSGSGATRTYTLATPTEADGAKPVSARNLALVSGGATNFTLTADSAVPTGGALTVNGTAASGGGSSSYDGDGSFTIGLRTDYTDAISQIATSTLTREDGSLAAGVCSSYGAPATLIATPAQNGLATGCYRYTLTGTDNVGNSVSITTEVKVDTSDPTAPGLTLADTSAAVHTTGTTAFYRPAGTGAFDVTASSSDTHSGIASYGFPALAGFTTSGSGASRTYTLATPTEADGAKTVTAQNNAGRSNSSTFTLTADSTGPTGGALSVNGTAATGGGTGSYDGDGSFAIGTRTDYSGDAGSGFATSVLTREDGTLSGDACSSYGAPATVTGNPAQSGLATGCYRYVLTGTDNVGNTSTVTTVVKVDTSAPPAPGLTLSDTSADVHTTGTTAFYRPAGTGAFDVTASATDGQSGVLDYGFPTLAGFTGSGSGATRTYTLATPTEADGAKSVTARNNALLSSVASTFTLTADSTGPTGGALSVNGTGATGGGTTSYDTDGSFAIGTRTDYSGDAGSGFATSVLTREDGTLSGDACSSYGAPASVTGNPAQTGLATGCYRYVLTGTDNVGNTSTVTTVVKVDTSDPSAPSLTLADTSADVHTTGTTAFYRPAGSGAFDVTASSSDAQSGIATYGFPALAGFTLSGTGGARTYTLATPIEADGAKTVTASNNAGRTNNSTFTLTADSTAPTGGALTVNGTGATGGSTSSYDADGSFAIDVRTDYTDAGSQIATSTLTRADGTLSGETCSSYGAPATVVGSPAQSGLATGCYRYTLTGTDNVGNAVSISTVVKVDTSDPSAPSLTLADTSADVHTTGTTAYYRPAGTGAFDVTAGSSDAQSGIASYSFPTLAGFTASGSGASKTYTLATPTEADGAKTVTASNNAGRTNNSTFTLTADSTGPTGGALSVNGTAATGGGSASYDTDGSFAIGTRTDYSGDAGSGLATSVLTREDGTLSGDACSSYGAPATVVGNPAQSGLATGCYRYTLTGTDNVGNAVSLATVVKVDLSDPSAPSLSLADTSADVYTTGTTAFYRPAGSGAFDVTASSSDAHSGIASYAFPALSGFTLSGSGGARTYTLATPTEADGAKTVTALNGAGRSDSSTFTLTADSAAPTGGALSVNGTAATGGGSTSYDTDGSFAIGTRTDYDGDAGSGLASSVLTREDGTLAGDACSSYGAPATVVGNPAQSGLATGCYRYTLTGTDNVGNTVSTTTVVKVDTSDPSAPSLTLTDTSADVHATATTAFYRPAGSGAFDVTASSTDAQSGVAGYTFPTLAGFTASGSGASRTYTLSTPTEADGAKTVTASNNAGRTNTADFTLTADAAAPSGGALTVNGVGATGGSTSSYDADGSFAIGTRTDYNDALSGLASSTLTREDGTLSGESCSSYGAPATVVGNPAQSGLATGCYRYTLTGTDNVGNAVSISTVVKVDTSDPASPTLTLSDTSADVHATGSTAYYRPAGTGAFDVDASSSDAHSGIASYSFPTLAGFSASGSGASRTYTLSTPTEADGAKTVTASNNAGRTNTADFTLTADAAAPTGGALAVNGTAATGGGTSSYDADGSFAIGTRTDYTDALSDLASSTLTREDGTLSGESCSSYGAPATIVGNPAQSGLATGCYRYTLTGTDNVGNAVSISTVVKVDTSAPAAPGLTLADTSADVHTTATTAFYRPAGSGAFDVTASSTDAQSGVLDYVFPTLAGFTGSGSGATRTYTLATPTEADGAKSVTARNNALLSSGASTFTLTADSTAPTGGALTVNGTVATGGGSASYDTDGAFAIGTRTDYGSDAGSGLAASVLTREDGTLSGESCSSYGAPSTVVGNPAQSGLTTGCYRYTLTGTDNVGNAVSLTTVVRVDTSDPAAPTLTLADSSAGVHATGTTAFYRPAGSGSFDVTASSSDAHSGIASYAFPTLAGFTASGTGATKTYTLATPTEADGAKTVTAENGAGRTNSADFTLTADAVDPTAGALAVNGTTATTVGTESYDADGSFAIGTRTDYTDTLSGIDSSTLTREDGTLAGDACSSYGAPATIVGSPAQSGLTTGCYRYTLTGTDNVGNSVSRTTVVKVDLTDPNAPSLTLADSSAGVHTTGTTAFYRPAGSGSFDVTASATDGQSNIAGYAFPALAGFVASGTGATKTYTLDTPTEADGAKTVTATNNAGRTNTSDFTLTADSTAPAGGTVTANGGGAYDTDGTVALAKVDYADGGSDMGSQTLTRAAATLTNDSCGSFSGADPVTISGGNDADTLATGCYRYTLTGTDNVGNQASVQSSVVKVDTTAPTAPTLTLSSATGSAYYAGTGSTIWFRSAAGAAGGFEVAASSTDGQTGVASYAFPALGAGWSQTGTGAARAYNYSDAAVEPGGKNVTATNGAGGVSANGTFTVSSDTTAPAGGSVTANGGATYDGDGTVALVKADHTDGGSGVATQTLTRASASLTADACGSFAGADAVTITGGVDADTLTTGCYRYTLTATDNVGNQGSVQSIVVKVDTSAPSAPSLVVSNLSANAHYAAGTLYIRPSAAGAFRVTATSTDAQTSVASYSFGSLNTNGGANFGGSQTGAQFDYTFDGTTTAPSTARTVTATNPAGGTSATGSYAIAEDTTGPTTSLTDPGANLRGTVALTATATDAGAGVTSVAFQRSPAGAGTWTTIATDSTAGDGFSASLDTTVPGDGLYDLRALATDNVGNTDTSVVAGRRFDNTSPTGTVTAPADDAIVRGSVALASDSADTGGSGVDTVQFQRSPAGAGTWTNQATPWATTGVADGDYDLRVVTTDNAGNTFTSGAVTVHIDNTNPTGSVTAPVDGLSVRGTISVASDSADAGGSGVGSVSFRRSPLGLGSWTTIDSDALAPYSVAFDTTAVADGQYDLQAVTTDLAGNTFASATVTVTVDNTAPNTTITASPADPTSSAGASFSFSSTEGDSTFECKLDAGSWGACATPKTYSSLSDGSHTFQVRGTDAAGNLDATPASFSWVVDTTNPTGSVTAPADAAKIRGASVSVTSNSADAGGSGVALVAFQRSPVGTGTWTQIGTDAIAPFATTLDTTALADGQYDLRTVTTDAAGNSFTSAAITVRIDNSDPTGSVTSPSAGASVRGTVTLASDSADSGSGVATVQFQRSPAGAGTWTNQAASWNTTAQADGQYDLRVVTTDEAGNSFTSAAVTVRVDNTLPTGSVTAPADGADVRGTIALTSNSADTGGSGVDSVQFQRSPAGAGTWTNQAASFDTTGVADGDYDLRVVTTDVAGNTFTSAVVTVTVDNTAPNTTITAQPTDPSDTDSPSFSFSSSEGSSTFECKLDTGAWGACTSAKSYSGLSEGSHTFQVRATDAAGNVDSTPASYTWVVDTVDPTGSVTAPADAANVRGTITLTSSSADAGGSGVATVQFQRSPAGAGTWTNQAASWNTTAQADGQYDLRVVTTDGAGNSFTSAAITVRVDNTDPTGAITAPADAANVRGTVALTSSSADTGGSGVDTVQFQRSPAGAGTWTNQAASWNTTGVSDGQFDLRVVTTDLAGNVFTSPTVTVRVDNTNPTGAVTAPADGAKVRGTITLTSSSADGGSGVATVQFQRSPAGAGTWTSQAASFDTTVVADGDYDLRVTTTDNAGNSLTSAAVTVAVDNTAPNTTITAQPASSSNTSAPSFSFASTESPATFECRIDGGSWGACTSPKSYTGLAQGSHTFDVRATDAAGNQDATAATHTWSVDSVDPTGAVTAPAAAARVRATVAVTSDSADTGGSGVGSVGFQRSLAGLDSWTAIGSDSLAPYSVDLDTTTLTDGAEYDLRAVTTDLAGNTFTSAVVTVTVDNTSPNTTITAQPTDPTKATGASFSFSASEAGSTFEVRLDGGSWSAATSPQTYTGLGEGSHTFDVRATDVAGNLDATAASYTWTVDTTDPNTTITAQPANPTNATGASFSFASTEGGSTFEVRLDGGSWSAATSPATYTGLAEGSHTFEVRATDPAANQDASAASYTWTVDTTAPNTTITAQPANPTNATGASFSFSSTEGSSTFECRIDGGSWSACATPKTYTGLTDGSRTVDIRATDPAGNQDPSAASYTWVVDTTDPTGSVTAPADAASVRGTITLTSDSADTGGSGVATVQFERSPAGAGTWTNQAASWNTTAQADGQYDLRVTTTDQAGNDFTSATITVRVDNTSPTATMTDPGANLAGTVTLTSTTADTGGSGIATVTYQRSPADAGTWTNQAASWNTTGVADGLYDLRVIAVDNAGNSTTSAVIEDRRVDNNAPTLSITAPTGTVNSGAADPYTVAASSPDNDLTQVEFFECPTAACATQSSIGVDTTAPYSISRAIPGDGSWTLKAVATDTALNTATDVETVTVERTRPQTTLDSGPAAVTTETGAAFGFSADEAGSTFECRIDGGSWSACTDPKSYAGLADGAHTFDVRATDLVGNTDLSPASFAWTVDTAAPNTTITAQPASPTNATGATFSFTSSEGSPTFECRIDGGSWGACTAPRSYSSLAQGSHTFDVRASDAAGNTDSTPASFTWTVDVTNPTGSVTAPGDGARVRATILLASDSADTGGSGVGSVVFERSPAGAGTWSATAASFDTTSVADGAYDLRVVTADAAGNVFTSAAVTVTVDNTPPDTTITAQPVNPTNATSASFSFSSNESGSSFECRIDGGSWSACATPKAYTGLAEGSHTVEVRARDIAGNQDASAASYTWTIDTTAPVTTITAQPTDPVNATGASFSFDSNEGGSSFQCRLDGGSWSGCTDPKTYAGLTEGPHTFEVRATDPAGNQDATPASHTWTVDTTAPNTTITAQPADPTDSTGASFSFSSSETGSSFEVRIDGGSWSASTSPKTYAGLSEASHTFEVRATDPAGNQDASAASHTWTIDTTAPTGSITAPAAGSAVSGAAVTVAANSADSGSGVRSALFERSPAGAGTWTAIAAADTTAPYTAAWNTTALGDGDYDIRVTTEDVAGNTFVSAARTVTVDNTAPTLSVIAPNPVNLASADPAAITATATDAGTGVASVNFEQCSAPNDDTCSVDTWTPLGLDTTFPYGVSWAIPSDGTRLLRVRATDGAGRQASELVLTTVDRTRPTGSLSAPVAAANLRGTSVALTATASDAAPGAVNTVTFQRSPAGANSWSDVTTDSSAPYGATLDTTGLADGLYDLRVFTTDVAGNAESTPATIQVRVDNTLPTGSVTAPTAAANVRGTITLTSNSADGGSGVATVQFQRSPTGAGTWTNQASSFDTTGVADGEYDVRVVTTDNAGNVFTSAAITIRVDNTLPTGSVTGPTAAANVRGTISLTSDSADSGSGVASVQFQRSPVGLATWTNQPASWNTTLQTDGQYDVRVVTTDNAGNVFTSASITIRVDNTAPTGSVTAPADGTEIGVPSVTLTSNSADGGSGVDTVVFERRPSGGGTWAATGASWNTATGPDAVADGNYDIRVTTTDRAGNVFSSAAITVLVDHTAPTTSASLAPGTPSNAPVTVSFSASDGTGSGVSAISYSVDGGTLQQGSAVVVAAPGDHSNDGEHVVRFFSTDEVGNVEAQKSVSVVIDTTAPSGTPGNPGDFLRGIANLSYATSATDVSSVQFQFSPASAGAWSNVGAADLAPPYEAAWNTGVVADGPYDLRAVVTDSTGNVANELLPSLPKTVDNTAPSGSVTAPAAGAYVAGPVDVSAFGTDGAAPPASGVSAVRFEVKPAGAGAFTVFGTQTTPVVGSTYRQSLATTTLADGPADVRVVVTDVAGNETTSAVRTLNVDNLAPVVSVNDPGAAVSGTATFGVTTSADTAQVVFERSVAGAGSWTLIGTDTTPGDGFSASLATGSLADGLYDIRGRATDGGGNTTTSAARTVRFDNTLPSGSVTTPSAGALVGGPAISLGATAADTGAGVGSVRFEVKSFGSGAFATVSTDTTAPYEATWDATSAADGAAEVRAVVTDAAGNASTTAAVTVTVDSTGPSVALADPGSVKTGTVNLSVTTGGGAFRVVFGVSPAGSASWTEIGSDTTAPFTAAFDSRTLADGMYDLRAVGYDSVGNASAPSLRTNVRFDNTAPRLVSSVPADGSLSTSVTQIVLTASEPVTASGALLNGAAAPAPTASGSTLTFPTGSLADGLHVLSGELQDASGTRVPFRVAVSVQSSPSADPPPVETSTTAAATGVPVEVPGGTISVTMPRGAWPTPPTSGDQILVLRLDASSGASVGAGMLAGSQVVNITARWALAGTYVTEFEEPLELVFKNASGDPVLPAWSRDGTTWETMDPIEGTTLPAGRRDGYYIDAQGNVHVLTKHLTYFGLMKDSQPPTAPRDVAGVVAGDGLTLRWVPGTDKSGRLGHVVLFVNGEPYRNFETTQYEAKLGVFTPGDTRTFTLVQTDAAGNVSPHTQPLRAVPVLVGKTRDQAAAALAAAGFAVGAVREETATTAAPGTVIAPADLRLALAATPIDLVVAAGGAQPPQTRLVFSVAGSKKLALSRTTTIPARIKVSRPAQVTATLIGHKKQRLYTWRLRVKAGANIVKLRLPAQIRRPGVYTLNWVARSGTETIRRSVKVTLVGPQLVQVRPKRQEVEVVLAGEQPTKDALTPGLTGKDVRIVGQASPEQTFALAASAARDVGVVIVDADAYGLGFVNDLRTVFPSVRLIVISRSAETRVLAIRAGAVLALPRKTTAAQLAKAIAAVSSR